MALISELIEEVRKLHESERDCGKLEDSLFQLLIKSKPEPHRRAELVSMKLQAEGIRQMRENLHRQVCALLNNSSADSLPAFEPNGLKEPTEPELLEESTQETPLPFISPPELEEVESVSGLASLSAGGPTPSLVSAPSARVHSARAPITAPQALSREGSPAPLERDLSTPLPPPQSPQLEILGISSTLPGIDPSELVETLPPEERGDLNREEARTMEPKASPSHEIEAVESAESEEIETEAQMEPQTTIGYVGPEHEEERGDEPQVSSLNDLFPISTGAISTDGEGLAIPPPIPSVASLPFSPLPPGQARPAKPASLSGGLRAVAPEQLGGAPTPLVSTPPKRAPRRDARYPVVLERDGTYHRGVTQNINHGGAFIESDLDVRFGEELTLLFQLSDGHVPAVGEVRWVRSKLEASEKNPAGFGLAFVKISAEDLKRLRVD